MKHLIYILFISSAVSLASCSSQQKASTEDTTTVERPAKPKELYAEMQIKDTINIGDPIDLNFKVINGTDSVKSFLKWQTPFEPLLSKYLDIKDEQGNEAQYIGAMARRVMPPPADAYLKIEPKDSLTATIDLLKGYKLEKPGKYTISFNSTGMNGLKVTRPTVFFYQVK